MNILAEQATWVGSPIDIRRGNAALKSLAITNDQRYWDDECGVIKVDEQRWSEAQQYESDMWLKYHRAAQDDRSIEHTTNFGHYRSLPNNLGKLIEIGCGPFTQTIAILNQGHTVKSITLSDPLLTKYLDHPNCTYKTKELAGYRVKLLASPAEHLELQEQFDTVVCINVLEHVFDVACILDNIFKMLRVNGYLVLAEKTHNSCNCAFSYDVGHPIRIRGTYLDRFCARFVPIFHRGNYFIGQKT